MQYTIDVIPFNEGSFGMPLGLGTPFMGVIIKSCDDLVNAVHKYACKKQGDKYVYQTEFVRFRFCHKATTDSIIAAGDKQCKDNGSVNLFSVMAGLEKDPLYDYCIYYRPDGWIDDNGKIFKFIISKGEKNTPFYGRLRDAAKEIGVILD